MSLSCSESDQSFNNEDCDAASENLNTDLGDDQRLLNTTSNILKQRLIYSVAHGCQVEFTIIWEKEYYWYKFYTPSYDPTYLSHHVWTCFLSNLLLEQRRGITAFFKLIFKDFAISAFTVYAESAKCVEHSTEYFWIVNFVRCLRANAVHLFSLSFSFIGKRCIETSSVC